MQKYLKKTSSVQHPTGQANLISKHPFPCVQSLTKKNMNSLKDTLPMTLGSDEVMVMVSDGGDGDGAMDGNVLPVAMFVKHTLYGSGEN